MTKTGAKRPAEEPVENYAGMVSKHTLDGVCFYASPACRSLLGYEPGGLVGRSIHELAHPEDRSKVERFYAALSGLQDAGTVAYRATRNDGTLAQVETVGWAMRDPDTGEVREIVTVSREASGHKEAGPSDTRVRFRMIFEDTAIGVALVDLASGRPVEVNPALQRMLGYSEDEVRNMVFVDFTRPEDVATDMNLHEQPLAGGREPYQIEKRYARKDGAIVWARLTVSPVREVAGEPRYAVSLVQDITGHKSAEARLRDAEARYSDLVERVPAVIYVDAVGEGRSPVYVSPQVEALLGYSQAEYLADPDYWVGKLHPEDREPVMAGFRRATETGEPFRMEYRLIARDGREVWVRDEAVPVRDTEGGRRLWQGVQVDITTLKRAEDLDRLNSHPGMNPNPVIEANLAGEVTYLNPATEKMFPDLEVLGSQHPMLAQLESAVQEVRGSGKPVVREVQVGESFYRQTISLVPGSNAWRVDALDVTERHRTEDALRASEELYRTVVERVAENIYVADARTGRIVESNAAFNDSLGYTPQEMRNLTLYDVVAHDRESIDHNIRLTLESGHYFIGERKYRRKDGTFVDMEVGVSMISHGGRDAVCVVAHDVTERKRVAEEVHTRAVQQRAVADLGRRALSGVEPATLLVEAVSVVAQTLGVEFCHVLESPPEGDAMLLRAGVGWGENLVGRTIVGTDLDSQAGYTLLSGEPVVVEDLSIERRFRGSSLLHGLGVVSGVSASIRGPNQPFGVLGAHTTKRRSFTPEDVDFLRTVANVLGEAVERKRVEEDLRDSHALLSSVIEGTADAIFVKDLQGRYVLVNSMAAEVMGRPEEEVIGQVDEELLGPEVAGPLVEVDRRVISTGSTITFEDAIPVAGAERTLLSTKAPYRDHLGKIIGVIGVATDITERKKAESALFEVREDERHRMARDLHDVVLHHIVGALQTMQAMSVEQGMEPQKELDLEIDALRRAVQGLRNAIYDLRLEKNEPFLRTVESLVDLNRQLAPGCQFAVTVEDGFPPQIPENVKVDLVRTVQEALTNARRHSGARRVEVRLGTGPYGEVLAEVADEGRGFDPGVNRDGVGLSGMRERANAIGAHLEVESAVGVGTRVKVSVPVRPSSPANDQGRSYPGVPRE